MDKKSYSVRNWNHYNKALVQRGNINFWISKDCLENWQSVGRTNKLGRPEEYSNIAIKTGLIVKYLFRLTFRAVEGFLSGLFEMLGIGLKAPNYTTLCKRQKDIDIKLPKTKNTKGGLNILIDSTGLKIYGEGEWKVRRYSWDKRRLWRKLHIAINDKSQTVEAFELTDLGAQDCEGMTMLINEIKKPINNCIGDGAYDKYSCYEHADRLGFKLIAPPASNAVPSYELRQNYRLKKINKGAIEQRDNTIKKVLEYGKKDWKIQSGYHRRSLAETAMFRFKTLFGGKLYSRKFVNQQIEASIKCQILNNMTELGMPDSVAIT